MKCEIVTACTTDWVVLFDYYIVGCITANLAFSVSRYIYWGMGKWGKEEKGGKETEARKSELHGYFGEHL